MTGEPTLTSVATNVRVTDCDELIISTVPRTHATDDDSAIDAVGDAVPARVTVVPSILEAKPSRAIRVIQRRPRCAGVCDVDRAVRLMICDDK
jgi:hypothetical protein